MQNALFYERLNTFCKLCPYWSGVCLRGHGLASPEGCPLKKFPPEGSADYAVDRPATPSAPGVARDCNGCGGAHMPSMTWGQVLASFVKSMAEWIKVGAPVVDSRVHGLRYGQCKKCVEFRAFYCRHCKCLCFVKSKLASEQCPLPVPRWVSANGPDG